jgi:D-amino-acid oxidase
MIPVYRLSTEESNEDPIWKNVVIGFEHLSSDEIEKLSREHAKNYKSGCKFVSFYCEPYKFLPYLIKRFLKAGGKFEKRDLHSFDDISDADLIINCGGIVDCEMGNKISQPIRKKIKNVSAPWIYDATLDDFMDGSHVIPCHEILLGDIHQVNDYSVIKFSNPNDNLIDSGKNFLLIVPKVPLVEAYLENT